MKPFIYLIIAASLLLTSCSGTGLFSSPTPAPAHEPCKVPKEGEAPSCGSSSSNKKSNAVTTSESVAGPKPAWSIQSDSQNGVTFSIQPLNLGLSEETINFQVTFDALEELTNQDLTSQASLSNDFHWSVRPVSWSGSLEGSRFSGILSFPAEFEGEDFLYQMASITITLTNLKAPQRQFSWQIAP
jgi:hypothetical protein